MANLSVNETQEITHFYDYNQSDKFILSFALPCAPEFPYQCPVAVCAICIALIGIIGNAAVIVSLIREKLYKKTSLMSILVLTVTDILCLIEFTIRKFIYFPNEFYIIEKGVFTDELCVIVFVLINTPHLCSCWNVMFLAYERYTLVTNPFVYIGKHTPKIVVKRAIITFVLNAIINTVYATIMTNLSRCPDFVMHPEYYGFITIPTIAMSMFSLTFFHCSKVYKIKNPFNKEGRHSRYSSKFSHMTKIVYIIVIIFFLSQIPYLIFDMVHIYESLSNDVLPEEYFEVILHIGIVVFLINYASNPFIYWLTPLRYACKRRSRKYSSQAISMSNQTKTIFKSRNEEI